MRRKERRRKSRREDKVTRLALATAALGLAKIVLELLLKILDWLDR